MNSFCAHFLDDVEEECERKKAGASDQQQVENFKRKIASGMD